MNTGPQGIALLHHFEGCKLKAYPDPATGGDPWTIGYGETGPHVRPGMVITQEQADQMFAKRLMLEFEPGVLQALRVDVKQNQFDALVSFAFNVGLGNYKKSTLLKMLNAGNEAGAADQFRVWNKAAGKVMKGLSRRREAERAVFLGASASDAVKLAEARFP